MLYLCEWDPRPEGFQTLETLKGMGHYAQQAGWIVEYNVNYLKHTSLPLRWDGVLAYLPAHPSPVTDMVCQTTVPVVDMSLARTDLPFPRVVLDNAAIGRLAAAHLIERGYQDLAFYTERDYSNYKQRREAFAHAVRAAGRRYHLLHLDPGAAGRTSEAHYRRLVRLIKTLPRPLGVMAAYDEWAITFLNACSIADIKVPEHFAVIAGDNRPLIAELAPVPLSCVISNQERRGYEAAELLDTLMDGAQPPREPLMVPPGGVVARRSTDIVVVPHEGVARALAFIQKHFLEPIGIAEVAHAAAMSESHLQVQFHRYISRTVHQELNYVRIRHACDLLRTTAVSIERVAEQAGFPSARRMSKVFRRELECSPREYRARNEES